MRRIILIILFFVQIPQVAQAAWVECLANYSALVFDDKNNQILFEKRADKIIYPASITKIMTAYLVFEALERRQIRLQQKIIISANAEDVGKINKINRMNLIEGDKITVEDLLKGMLVRSFNEASTALAEAIAGDEWQFAKMMNKKAEELKMSNTNFRNASGLHEQGHYTTNYDMARLVKALEKKFPQYRKYFALKEFKYNGIKYQTTNHLLLDYKGVDGFKTGFTTLAGFNLVASAKHGAARIDAVLTGCESFQNRDQFMKTLLNEGFKQIERKKLDAIVLLKT